MSVRTDRVNLIVNVSGDAAKKQMNDLTKRAAQLKSEMRGLKKSSAEYINKSKELKAVKGQMDALRKTMNVTALSQKELTAELRKLKALKNVATPQTKEYYELQKQIEKVQKRLTSVRRGTFGFKNALAGLKTEVKQFGVLAASYLGFEFITGQFSNIIRGTAKLSDQLADIRKTAGLTEPEVRQLNGELAKLGTRTSTKELREIVKVLGQMGFAKEDLLGSATAIDKIVVALGDEFGGGAEQITNILGKLRNSLTDLKTGDAEKDLLAIGNALNVLGSEGIATAPVVSDMAQRLSGAGVSLGLTSGQILGLSAAMEEMGISAEVGGTAIVKILNKIAKDPAQFASVAGKSIREFTNLVNTDISQALLLVAKGFNNSKGKATEFAERLGDAEITGARVLEVMAKLGNNTELAGEKIGAASEALLEQDSIMDEFAIKNENFAATLDKLSKEFNKLVFSPAVQNFLTSAIEGALRFVQGLKEIPQWIEKNRGLLILLTAFTLKYVIAKNAVWLAERRLMAQLIIGDAVRKARLILTQLSTTATFAYGVAKAALTGNIKLATRALVRFNIISKLSPIAAITTLVIALGAAWLYFSRSAKKANIEARLTASILGKANAAIADQVARLKALQNILKSSNTSLAVKRKAYEELISIHPEFKDTMTLDINGHLQGADAIDKFIVKLREKAQEEARASIASEKRNEIIREQTRFAQEAQKDATRGLFGYGENLSYSLNATIGNIARDTKREFNVVRKELRKELLENPAEAIEKIIKSNEAHGLSLDKVSGKTTESLIKIRDAKKELAILDKRIEADTRKRLAQQQDPKKPAGTTTSSTSIVSDKKTKTKRTGKTDAQRKLEREARALEAFKKKVRKIDQDIEAARLSKDDREIEAVIRKYANLLKEADKFGKKLVAKEVKILGEAKAKELNDLFDKQFNQRQEKYYDSAVKNLEKYHQQETDEIKQQFASGEISQKEFDDEIIRLDVQHIRDRITLANNYSAKAKKAAKDAEDFKTKALEQGIEERIEREETEAKERIAQLRRGVLTTPEGSESNRSAKRLLANEQFQLDTQGLDENSEQFKLRYQELLDELKEIDKDHTQNILRSWQEIAQQIGSILSNVYRIVENADTKRLRTIERNTEAEKKNYDNKLKHRLISRKEYDANIERLDTQLDQKKREQELKTANRQKALGIFSAVVNTAAGAARAFADYAFPYSAIIAGLVGIAGATQIAAIASEPVPVGRKGLVLKGPSHEQGGVDMIDNRSGKRIANVEGGEAIMVFSKDTYGNNKEMLDELMYASNYEGGRSINWLRNRPTINVNKAIPALAKGGYVNLGDKINALSSNPGNSDGEVAELLRILIKKQEVGNSSLAKMPTSLKAHVLHKDIRERDKEYSDAKNEVGI